jgi:hypothetical protein
LICPDEPRLHLGRIARYQTGKLIRQCDGVITIRTQQPEGRPDE